MKDPNLTRKIQKDKARPVTPKLSLNEEQKIAKQIILDNPICVLIGMAGSGKTLLAVQTAADLYFKREYSKIIITRPTVTAGEEIGWLPGSLEDKLDPFLQPIYSNLHQLYGKERIDKMVQDGDIEIIPFAFMRGRAQPLHSNVLTPSGWKKMGDMQLNDEIVGSDGNIYNVNGIFPQGVEDVYKITFKDDSSTLASGNHLWEVYSTQTRNPKSQIKTTNELKDDLYDVRNKKKWKIPMVENIEFENKSDLKIHPYLLGALLGDGCMASSGKLTYCTVDDEMIQLLSPLLPEGLVLKQKGNTIDYQISKKIRNNHISNDLIDFLEELNLHGLKSPVKFIPSEYLYTSIENRLELLRGLMDTDGCISPYKTRGSKTSTISTFSSTSEKLIEGVKFIVESLGGTTRCRKRISRPTMLVKNHNYEIYELTIRIPQKYNPFKLSRKANLFKVKEKPVRLIKSIEKYSVEETQCISVTAPNNLYITDNFIVTHNTFLDAIVIIDEAQNITDNQMQMAIGRLGKGSKMVICGDTAQIDLKNKKDSGLSFLSKCELEVDGLKIITLKENHRHEIVQKVLDVYKKYN